uniref:Uncharacterized protein n=1 Tax=Panagrolaimus davidi TaxID=227884 RepID=A0A914QHE5_9BILA
MSLSVNDYIPKKTTQQNEFLKKYPEYDGRGLVIAIIDTGIDVSMPGMQYTSTGLAKIIDCFNFYSDGMVNTSVIKELGVDNTVIGLSGRILKVS